MATGGDLLSDEHFKELKSVVSEWYDRRGYISKLKVLYGDLLSPSELHNASRTMDLLNLLIDSDELNSTNLTLLYDTIKVSNQFGLVKQIKEKLPLFPIPINIKDNIICKFSPHRQKLMKLGSVLTEDDVAKIDGLYNETLKNYRDSWGLIMDLEKRREICDGKMEKFVGKLENLELQIAVDALCIKDIPNVSANSRQRHGEGIAVKLTHKRKRDSSNSDDQPYRKYALDLLNDLDEHKYCLTLEDMPEFFDKFGSLIIFYKRYGLDLNAVGKGSVVFHLSTNDPYALMNLWEIHLSGELIKCLAEILVPQKHQQEYLDEWMTYIDELEYKAALGKLKAKVENDSYDFCIISDDVEWENKLMDDLQKRRPNIKCTSQKDLSGGELNRDNLITQTEKSKKVILGFSTIPVTVHPKYAAHTGIVEEMLEQNTLHHAQLIPVKISEDALVPPSFKFFTVVKAWEEHFVDKLLQTFATQTYDDCSYNPNISSSMLKEHRSMSLESISSVCSTARNPSSGSINYPYNLNLEVLGRDMYGSSISLSSVSSGYNTASDQPSEPTIPYEKVVKYFCPPHKAGELRNKVADMLFIKKRKLHGELSEGKEHEKELARTGLSLAKSCQDIDDIQQSTSYQQLSSQGTMAIEPHVDDICESLSRFSSQMIHYSNVIKHAIESMRRNEYRHWIIIRTWIQTEFKEYSSEDVGRMLAHVLIAVEDENGLLETIHELCTDDVVKGLSAECQKLNFKYNITQFQLYYSSSSIAVSFFVHLLSNAPRLKRLCLTHCNIKGATLKDIVDVLSVEGIVLELNYLNISHNKINDIKGCSLATLLDVAPKLIHVSMKDCSLSGVIVDDMITECCSRGVLLKLRNLHINDNNLNDIKGSSLATLLAVAPKLSHLYMYNCSLPGVVVDDMVKECSSRGVLLKLSNLHINDNNLNDIKGSSLATLLAVAPKLNLLAIHNCSLSGAIVDDITKECSGRGLVLELNSLNITQNNLKDIKGYSLATFLAVAPKLIHLFMDNCSLSGIIVDDMVKECSTRGVVLELSNLHINDNNLNDIKGSSLATLLTLAPKLRYLHMCNCSLSGVIVDDMVKECSSRGIVLELENLDISLNNLDGVKRSSLTTLLALAPKLKYLNMNNCSLSGDIVDDLDKEGSCRMLDKLLIY